MADFVFTREFLLQFSQIERVASRRELEFLEAALAEIANNPGLADRFATHYDPAEPSYFVRRGSFLIRFSEDSRTGDLVFRTLFRRRTTS